MPSSNSTWWSQRPLRQAERQSCIQQRVVGHTVSAIFLDGLCHKLAEINGDSVPNHLLQIGCRIRDDYIDLKRYPLFMAREVVLELLAQFKAKSKVDAKVGT